MFPESTPLRARLAMPERGSAEARGIDEDRVEDWLQVVERVRNGAQHLRDCRLFFNEFGYLP
jgi:hypothetical protein